MTVYKKNFILILGAAALAITPASAQEETTRLIYPSAAADTELDASTPAKRITPPVREDVEYDPLTPLGQIRGIVTTLDELATGQETIKENQTALAEIVGKLQLGENKDLLPLLERGAKGQSEIAAKLDKLADVPQMIRDLNSAIDKSGDKIDKLEKITTNVRAINESRAVLYLLIAILALLLCQIVWKFGAAVVATVKRFVYAQAVEIANKQQAESAETKQGSKRGTSGAN